MAKSIAILGTASNTGKTLIVTSLCKALTDMGYSVAPFKAINVTSNVVQLDSLFVPLTQYLQTIACKKEYNPCSCPVLLNYTQQICSTYINGIKCENTGMPSLYFLKDSIEKAYLSLLRNNDFVIVEGSGAAIEPNQVVNLSNFYIIEKYRIPTILVSDIQYGGAFASLIGTFELLPTSLRSFIKGYILNKFVGDKYLLKKGIDILSNKYDLNCLGILNKIEGLYFPSEDTLDIKKTFCVSTLDFDEFERSLHILAKEIDKSSILKNVLSLKSEV